MQCANKVLMVRPIAFTFNEQTAENNSFQDSGYKENAQENALEEFDNYVKLLSDAGVEVIVCQDTLEPHTPDSIFPNNWFTTHLAQEMPTDEKTLILYPMNAKNRRFERDKNVQKTLQEKGIHYKKVIDLTYFEKENLFLEGTGSLILDRNNKIAFCCSSPRTSEEVLEVWADKTDYSYFMFDAQDKDGNPIYHTNVMMCIGEKFAFICLDSIPDISQRMSLIEILEENDKEIIEISFEQMEHFAGNMLVVRNKENNLVLVLSQTAKESLDDFQLEKILRHYSYIVSPNINYIEKNGGGSARCMLAEIF